MPVISALMVFHRDTPFLRPAIASVLNQTLADLELVLVDNGTGLSAAQLGDLGGDSRVRWVRLPRNEGIPAGHNAGVAAARGEFLALLDYDDVALPRRFERQVERLRAEPRLGLVSSLAETIDERGVVTGREFSLVEPEAQYAYSQYAAPVVTPAYTGRREVFTWLPYRAEFPWAADYDFLARAAELVPMKAVPEVLLQYRRHSGQTTAERAAAIEDQRAAIRVLTAQRRSGQPEDRARVATTREAASTPAANALWWARRNREAGMFSLAAYHARRALALERTFCCVRAAILIGTRAVWQARGRERRLAARLFLSGPVLALGLRPA